MTASDLALLGARLLLIDRPYLTPRQLALLPDRVVLQMADLLTTEN